MFVIMYIEYIKLVLCLCGEKVGSCFYYCYYYYNYGCLLSVLLCWMYAVVLLPIIPELAANVMK